MTPSRPWLLVAVLLTVVWSGVAIVMRMTDHAVSSPATVYELMTAPIWSESPARSGSSRDEALARVISKFNRLTASQRSDFREEHESVIETFLDQLSEDELETYVDQTIRPKLDAILKGLRAMAESDRKSFVSRIRKDLRERPPPGMPEEMAFADDEILAEVMDEELEAQFRDASVETKLKFAPMLESIQNRLQGFGRR